MKSTGIRKVLSLLVAFVMVFQQVGFTQGIAQLNIAKYINNSPIQDNFRPLHLRYFSYNPVTDNFQILLDKGSLKEIKDSQVKEQGQELLKYFLIGVSLPDKDFWVNLRPDSEDQIITPELAKTDFGKVLLEADLQLKKDVARFTSPETPEGKEYWDKLYQKAGEIFNSANITIPTLTRPWIVPGEVIIRQTQNSAYVYKATLKVMLEQDHLKGSSEYNFSDPRLKQLNDYSSQLIREKIIPKLTKEVNSSARYASLRQVFYSLILARWFKHNFSGKEGLYPQLIDTRNLNGLTSQAAWSKTTYFQEYHKSFANGEYNIKQQVNTVLGPTIRSYFSGGIALDGGALTVSNLGAESKSAVFNGRNNSVTQAFQGPDTVVLGGYAALGAQELEFLSAITIEPAHVNYGVASKAFLTTEQSERWALAEKIMGRTLTDDEFFSIIEKAHEIGAGHILGPKKADGRYERHATNPYAAEEIQKKGLILKKLTGITAEQVRALIEFGVAGDTGLPLVEAEADISIDLGQLSDLVPVVKEHGLELMNVKVRRIQGEMPPEDLFGQPQVPFLVGISTAQALGSYFYAGEGKEVKDIADANAVYLSDASIRAYVQANPNAAVVIIADEGRRDKSVSLEIGSIYYSGYEGMRREFSPAELKKEIASLQAQGVTLSFFVGDSLEVTNGLVVKEAVNEPTNSWSLAALLDESNSLVDDKARIGGISFNAPTDGGVSPFDLPSEALLKIAIAQGIEEGSKEFEDFMNHSVILTLGPRELKKEYEVEEEHRHQAIINDARELQKNYPGLKLVLPGDGDLMPRVISSLGLTLDGYQMYTFGRSGSAEAAAARLSAKIALNGQFSNTYVSTESTNSNYSLKTAYNYTTKERGRFEKLGIPEEEYLHPKTKDAIKGGGILAMTSVTGASADVFGESFSKLLRRVQINPMPAKDGTITTNTLVLGRDGSAFVVRVTFHTDNLIGSENSIRRASPEAKRFIDTRLSNLVQKARWGSAEEKAASYAEIDRLAQAQGIFPASMFEVYEKMAKGEITGVTVAAINVRTDVLEQMRRIFREQKDKKIGLVIFELALSEKGYTVQPPAVYKATAYVAAMMEGYQGSVFLQADHYQIKADAYTKDPNIARQGQLKTITEAVEADHFGMDLDNSTLVALPKPEEFVDYEAEEVTAAPLSDNEAKIRGLAEQAYASWKAVLGEERINQIKEKVKQTLTVHHNEGFYSDIIDEIDAKLRSQTDTKKAADLTALRQRIADFRRKIENSSDALSEELFIQQVLNAQETAIGIILCRGLEAGAVKITIGGEIGEVGGKNSEPGEFVAYLEFYNAMLEYMVEKIKGDNVGAIYNVIGTSDVWSASVLEAIKSKDKIAGLSKVAIQTGTGHGVGGDIDFRVIKALAELGRKVFGVVVVQHGASKVSVEKYSDIVSNGAGEVHLATLYMEIVINYLREQPRDSEAYAIYKALEDAALKAKFKDMTPDEIEAQRDSLVSKLKIAEYRNGLKLVQERIDNLPPEVHTAMGDKFQEVIAETFRNLGLIGTQKYLDTLASSGANAGTDASLPSKGASANPAGSKAPDGGVGGIDFRAIPMITQPMGNLSGLNFNLPKLSNVEKINLDEEINQIKNLLQADITPSGERLKEYVAACYQRGELRERMEAIVMCLVNTCRLEEERVTETPKELKEVLLILDAVG